MNTNYYIITSGLPLTCEKKKVQKKVKIVVIVNIVKE